MNAPSIIDVKIFNTQQIINSLRFNDGLTKKDIASITGLSFATVANICRELVESGILQETSTAGDITVGRSPKLVSLKYNSFFCGCLDMHNTKKMALAIVNLRNEILIKKEIVFHGGCSLDEFIEECYLVCIQACENIGIGIDNLLGLCAAVPAIFDHQSELTIASGIELIDGQPFKAILERKFKIPVFVDNESNICAMSISMKKAHASSNILYILCSEGLGAGIITGNKQLIGSRGYSSELCHIPIGNEKLICHLCGNAGCVESDLSIYGYITKYLGYAHWDTDKAEAYWYEFLQAIEADNENAMEVLRENAIILGKLSSILINLFDPETVYYGGEVSVLFERMKPYIATEIIKRSNVKGSICTQLLPDEDENTLLYGCSELVYRKANLLQRTYINGGNAYERQLRQDSGVI